MNRHFLTRFSFTAFFLGSNILLLGAAFPQSALPDVSAQAGAEGRIQIIDRPGLKKSDSNCQLNFTYFGKEEGLGAFAVSQNRGCGYAVGGASQKAVDAQAIAKCEQLTRSNCHVAARLVFKPWSLSDSCAQEFAQWQSRKASGAFSVSQFGYCSWTSGRPNLGAAVNAALRQCQQKSKGQECKILQTIPAVDQGKIASGAQKDNQAQGAAEHGSTAEASRLNASIQDAPIRLAGDWFGVASCRNRLQQVRLELFSRNGAPIQGFLRSTNSIRVRVGQVQGDAVELILGDRNTRPARIIRRAGLPPFLQIELTGSCRRAFVFKANLHPDIGGRVSNAMSRMTDTKPGMRGVCNALLDEWLALPSKHHDLAYKLKSAFDPILNDFDPEQSKASTLFADQTFTHFFGRRAQDFSDAAFDSLETHLRACVAAQSDASTSRLPDGHWLFTSQSIKRTSDRIRRNIHLDVDKLQPTRLFSEFRMQRKTPRQYVEALLGDWKVVLSASDPVRAAGKLVEQHATAMSKIPPLELKTKLDKIFAEARRAKGQTAAAGGGGNELSGRKPSIVTADHLEGYTLLSPIFGHYVYVRNADVRSGACARNVEVKVRLSSLLALGQLENDAYLRRFFAPSMFAMPYLCGWPSEGRGNGFNIEYLFDGDSVGSFTLRVFNRNYQTSNINLLRQPASHPVDHPDYVFDKAFAALLGTSNVVFSIDLPEFSEADLNNLARRGDLQALTHAAIASKDRFRFFLTRPVRFDVEAMKRASAAGSTVAAFLLADELARQTRLLHHVPQAQVDFAALPTEKQHMFLFWLGKAQAGGVFATMKFDAIVRKYDLDTTPVKTTIASKGFAIEPSDMATLAPDTTTLTVERARRAFNAHVLERRCNKTYGFMAGPSGWQSLGALSTEYNIDGEWCVTRFKTVSEVITSSGRLNRLTNFQCDSNQRTPTCEFRFGIHINYDVAGSLQARRAFGFTYGAISRAAESTTYPAKATFTRVGADWRVLGDAVLPQ